MIIEKQETSPGYLIGEICKGGAGSGNFGHSGRPGEVGGSSREDSRKELAEEKVLSGKDLPQRYKDTFRLASGIKLKIISDFRMPAINDRTGEEIPGKEDSALASLIRGELKTGKNKGRILTVLRSSDFGISMSGFVSDQNWSTIRKSMYIEDLEEIGLKYSGSI